MQQKSIFFLLFLLTGLTCSAQWAETRLPSFVNDYAYLDAGNITYAFDENTYRGGYTIDGINWRQTPLLHPFETKFESIIGAVDDTICTWRLSSAVFQLMVSTNRGESWIEKDAPQLGVSVYASHYQNNRIFIATETGVWYSDNFGDNWQSSTGIAITVPSKVVSIGSSLFLFVNDQFLISTDGGATWNQKTSPIGLAQFKGLFSDGNVLYLAGDPWWGFDGLDWYLSSDLGTTWTLNANIPRDFQNDFFTTQNAIFLSNTQGTTSRSTDGGNTWTSLSKRIWPIDQTTVHDSLNLISKDNGQTWQFAGFGLDNEFLGAASSDQMMFVSQYTPIGGNQFTLTREIASTDPSFKTLPLHINPSNLAYEQNLVISVDHSGNLIKSIDGGVSFESVGGGIIQNQYWLTGLFKGTIYLIQSSGNGQMLYSTDFGFNIQPVTGLPLEARIVGTTTNEVFAVKLNEVFSANKSNPKVFTKVLHVPIYPFSIEVIGEHLFIANAGTIESTLFRFNGSSLDTCKLFPHPNSITSLTGIGHGDFHVLLTDDRDRACYKSIDAGETWTLMTPATNEKNITFQRLFKSKDHIWLEQPIPIGFKSVRLFSIPIPNDSIEHAKGLVFHDLNQNGLREPNEPPARGMLLKNNSGFYAVSDTSGEFTIDYQKGVEDTVRFIPNSAYQFSTTPLTSISTNVKELGVGTVSHQLDLSVSLTNDVVFRPGFNTTVYAHIRNLGTIPAGGQLQVVLPPQFDFLESTPAPTNMIGDTLYFDVSQIPLNEHRSIEMKIKTDLLTPINTNINMSAVVSTFGIDAAPQNNSNLLESTVVGSYDPNDKAVQPIQLHPDKIVTGERLTYTVRFQNTGNYPASFVRILDTLDHQLDLSTLRIEAASHTYTWNIRGKNVLDILFDDINLADSVNNEPESHGFVKFSIEAKRTLQLADQASNTAHIYFDFNLPIATNTVKSTVSYPVGTFDEKEEHFKFSVSPNPGRGNFQVNLDHPLHQEGIVQIFDSSGRIVTQSKINASQSTFSLPEFKASAGVYVVRLVATNINYSQFLVID